MKALIAYGPGDLRLVEKDVPSYGPGDVLIRVKACGVCHTDLIIVNGGFRNYGFPNVIGHEFGGLAEECGSSVTHVKKGDKVTVNTLGSCGCCRFCHMGEYHKCGAVRSVGINLEGGFQEFISLPASFVYKIPDTMSFEEAAMVEPAANAYGIVDQAHAGIGDNVAVVGPGAIGLVAVNVSKLRQPGLLIAVGTRRERLETAKALGATHAVNIRDCDPYEEVMRLTEGRGADVVYWCGGERDAWDLSRNILGVFGKLLVEAIPASWDAEWNVRIDDFNNRMHTIIGARGYTPRQYEETIELIRAGHLDVKSLVTHRYAIEDYKEAFAAGRDRRDGAIKVMIVM